MKIKFAISEIINPFTFNEPESRYYSEAKIVFINEKTFDKYEDAENEIKAIEAGAYQIQKIFVIE